MTNTHRIFGTLVAHNGGISVVYFIDGSAAKRLDPINDKPKHTKVPSATKPQKNVDLVHKEKILVILLIVVCVLIGCTVIYNQSRNYQLNADIHKLQIAIKAAQNRNSMLQGELARLSNPERIKSESAKLGLQVVNDTNTLGAQINNKKPTQVPPPPPKSTSTTKPSQTKQNTSKPPTPTTTQTKTVQPKR